MKRLLIMCVCVLVVGLMTGKAFGQAGYCKDYLENGNPGGTAGLKTFEEEAPYSTTESRLIDIWVCDLRPDPIGAGNERLISGGFEIVYDPSITVVDITIYTELNGGPWDSVTAFVDVVPGENKIEVGMLQLFGVLSDVDNDVILAKLEVQGTGTITFSPIQNFDTIVSNLDGFVYDPEIIPNEFTVGGCTVNANCDDGAYCTGVESCNPVSDLCETTGNPCTPPDVCNEVGDICETPECVVDGDCDDGIGCTDDTCDAGVCVNTPNDANCPDDGTFCNGTEFCNEVLDCTSTGDPCPPLLCDEGLNACVVDCLGDGDCDDGIGCTDDTCDAGVCVSTPNDANCDDLVGCTDDTCDETNDCQFTPNDANCDDLVGCTDDTCDETSDCQFTPNDANCNDGVDCTDDTCDETNDCQFTPNDTLCPDDGFYCTGDEFCHAVDGCSSDGDPCPPLLCDEDLAACVNCLLDGDCDDGIECTADTCDAGACVSTPKGANCPDDGAFCNGIEFCDGALDCTSTGNPCSPLLCDEGLDACVDCLGDGDCDDGVDCTDDTCDAGSCVYTPNDTLCPDDGTYCNGTEFCDVTNDCSSDGDPCLPQLCDEGLGACVDCQGDADCDDGAYCTGVETCVAGSCQSGNNPCPGQSCNESSDQCFTTTTTSTGGITTTTTAPPSECTTDEECNDDNSCTDDVCDAGSCSNSPLDDGAECEDDGVYCNGIETCVKGICQPGGNPCPQDQECNEEEDICVARVSIEASTGARGSSFLFLLGVVTIQGTGTDFTLADSVVTYDSPLVLKGLKLVDFPSQTIRQIILLWPSIIFPALSYPAVVTVTVDGLSDEIEIGSFIF